MSILLYGVGYVVGYGMGGEVGYGVWWVCMEGSWANGEKLVSQGVGGLGGNVDVHVFVCA